MGIESIQTQPYKWNFNFGTGTSTASSTGINNNSHETFKEYQDRIERERAERFKKQEEIEAQKKQIDEQINLLKTQETEQINAEMIKKAKKGKVQEDGTIKTVETMADYKKLPWYKKVGRALSNMGTGAWGLATGFIGYETDPKTGEEPWGAMACVVIPSAVFKKLGGLDEKNFFLYCDDVDFSWRLRLNGYKVIYRPRAFVYHAKRIDDKGGVQPTNAELYYSAEAALLMAYKYSDDARLKRFLELFEKGSEQQKKAAAEFYRRKENGLLTERLDKDHKIASFTEWGYSLNRY